MAPVLPGLADSAPHTGWIETPHQRQYREHLEQRQHAARRYPKLIAEFTSMLLEVSASDPAKSHNDREHDIRRAALMTALETPRQELARIDSNSDIPTVMGFQRAYRAAAKLRVQYVLLFPPDPMLCRTILQARNDIELSGVTFRPPLSHEPGLGMDPEPHGFIGSFFWFIEKLLADAMPDPYPNPPWPPGFSTGSLAAERNAQRIASVSTDAEAASVILVAAAPLIAEQSVVKETATHNEEEACSGTPVGTPRDYMIECLPHFLLDQLNAENKLDDRRTLCAVLLSMLSRLLRKKFGDTPAVLECLRELSSLVSEPRLINVTRTSARKNVPQPRAVVHPTAKLISHPTLDQPATVATEARPPTSPQAALTLTAVANPIPTTDEHGIRPESGASEDTAPPRIEVQVSATTVIKPTIQQPTPRLPKPVQLANTAVIPWASMSKKNIHKTYKPAGIEVARQLLSLAHPSDYDDCSPEKMKTPVFRQLARAVRTKFGPSSYSSDPRLMKLCANLAIAIEGRKEAMDRFPRSGLEYELHQSFYKTLLEVRHELERS
ncbi:uncharacterized protein MYCGRDRAFT_96102 [Zymoseptoria tritici IPO323]|uniref:Uncharacterized protein n=1 Tax=Zymoseptoria tritici (strain CBS 115943 / IPO323) TaxID=336722 RepID=F9XLA8_ZYMTI|nr:uncharacterized protein MYCGRDRAFT_96102 [Zymoseptoria tritici IPO323]EGP84173.1 hypothetical protein MYCGRDRAFT_96102 [Zymoseptoria tritici IPO323]